MACNLHVDSFCVITTASKQRRDRLNRALVRAVAALEALVQSNVSMHALPHDPSFIILTLATFLKWRKMLQSALPLVSENMHDRARVRVARARFQLPVEDKEGCVCMCVHACALLCVSPRASV